MVLEHLRLRWAREDSVDLIGNSGQRPGLIVGRRGREPKGSANAPGSINRPASRHDITSERMIWSIRPQGTSAKNWSPDWIGAAAVRFEWIAQGCTAKSFWAAPWRLITELEGRQSVLIQVRTGFGPTEPE